MISFFKVKVSMNESLEESDWFIANLKHAGFMRVNYDKKNWDLLIDQLKRDHNLIDKSSRASLLDDSFNLGRAEVIDQLTFMEMSLYLKNEIEPLPFIASFASFEYIYDMIVLDSQALQLLNVYYQNLLLKTYNNLGWDDDLKDANEM